MRDGRASSTSFQVKRCLCASAHFSSVMRATLSGTKIRFPNSAVRSKFGRVKKGCQMSGVVLCINTWTSHQWPQANSGAELPSLSRGHAFSYYLHAEPRSYPPSREDGRRVRVGDRQACCRTRVRCSGLQAVREARSGLPGRRVTELHSHDRHECTGPGRSVRKGPCWHSGCDFGSGFDGDKAPSHSFTSPCYNASVNLISLDTFHRNRRARAGRSCGTSPLRT
jgi:hypothetical protein